MEVIDASRGSILVEGRRDRIAMEALLQAHKIQPFSSEQTDPKQLIKVCGSDKELMATIDTAIKNERVLGVVLDANTKGAKARWQAVTKKWSQHNIKPYPDKLQPGGYIGKGTGKGRRVGLWVMPDNASNGYLEDFLLSLIAQDDKLAAFADSSSHSARRDHGAKFSETHHSKAVIYSWLAWCKEPGNDASVALKSRWLDPDAPNGRAFVAWVRNLFKKE